MTTRKELEEALAKIGWRITNSHNGLNDYIINHFGERTSFVVDDNTIGVRNDNIFGGDTTLDRGLLRFRLSHINITHGGDLGKTEYVCLNFNDGCYIQFYNHEK